MPLANSGNAGFRTISTRTVYVPTPKQQVFHVIVTGLKPLTTHNFYFDGLERGSDCKPDFSDTNWGTNTVPAAALGSPLISDQSGKLVFDFFFTPTVADSIDSLSFQNNNYVGDKLFEVRAASSAASKIVPIRRKDDQITGPSGGGQSTPGLFTYGGPPH